ncbi:MvaI/BcnI family restriction endonuclease [Bifidobacterium oedipodis]|uniref:MvaI/BcnI restriction endonuclease family n=1 Tax=Bifidobacterium oedipodis TaxID=2675322 RepID=A0A7Y0HTC2_9BIFI|nr:MvaI/BcnI family restriction endonuclease [Bifidobacterium sp. DSM 109957]NMM93499.1 MvaI/BcnI restriction endonuclease family [Bifidobacterium sp. DSM 109957]
MGIVENMNDTHVNDDERWFDRADIQQVHDLLTNAGAESIWVKRLVPNNNSKQQIFLGSDPSDLAFLPLGTPQYKAPKSQKKKAGPLLIRIPVPWRWVTPNGEFNAPNANMCFYPQYPEVRFSGFLQGCKEGPSELMGESKRGHELNRCMFFGTVKDSDGENDHVVALVVGASSPAAQYVLDMDTFEKGHICPVFYESKKKVGEFSILEEALVKIMGKKIVPWRRLNSGEQIKPYIAPNAPGLTLEAELGVGENAIPGPDFDVWELKAISQKSLERRNNHRVTLFTPQPDLGWITNHTQAEFVLKYGHVSGVDENGKPNEYYFTSGDINRFDESKEGAKLNLRLVGFTDSKNYDPNGMIALYDKETGELAAGWSYLKLLEHWQRKHNRAAYVPYIKQGSGGSTTVEFGPLITLGLSTSFGLFLQAFQDCKAIYDPGDKITLKNGSWTPHPRSQFRININDINAIYQRICEIDLRTPETMQEKES